jgi:hypothetical protein
MKLMKYKLILISLLFISSFLNAQNDSIFVSEEKFEKKIEVLTNNFNKKINDLQLNNSFSMKILLDSLYIQNKRLRYVDSILTANNNALKKRFVLLTKSLKDSINSAKFRSEIQIRTLEKNINKKNDEIVSNQEQLKNNLGIINNKNKTNFEDLYTTIISKSKWGYLLIFGVVLLALCLFYVLRKKFSISTIKLESEQLKLDQKLIELYDSQLVKQKQENISSFVKDEDIDHSLALKVGDEIIRMRKNLSSMPEGTKGLKQLSKALQRIQDTFKVNGYEMIEMLNKPYNEGMKVVANFVPDENLEDGQQIITRIIKSQINFKGVMIQSAQIEVSVGE